MTESAPGCPELGALEEVPLSGAVRAHVAACVACRLVVDVFDQAMGRLDLDDCLRFDALLAARTDGTLGLAGRNLLERHLAGCEACRAVADTLSPTSDAHGDHATLPRVDPAGYALGLEVARGGMGRILAARDLRVGRPVAVKELLGRSPQLAARFEREARVTARLQHPGIVPIYEIGRWPDGTPFYSMRMVDGRTLHDAIDATPTLAGRLALLPALIAASEAIAFAHAQRVIHRDLTPSNVLVGAYGETVVIDWGLAKDLVGEPIDGDDELADPYRHEHGGRSLTGVGAVIGTAAYMPPEQAHALPVDERADVYALGAILYHLLAGAPPYRARTTAELLRAVKTGPPRPIVDVAPGTPRDLVSIVAKAMARDPDARYPSARELADELKRFQTGQLIEAHAYSRGELVLRFLRRYRAAVTVTALAAVLLAGGAAVSINRIVRSGADARAQVRNLLEERGRIELLDGSPLRALAYLHAAYARGEDTASLRFLLASAMRDLTAASSRDDFDCGGEVRRFAISNDGTYLAAACRNLGRVWKLTDPKHPISLGGTIAGGFDAIAYSPDNAVLATWGADGVARLWDARTGQLRWELRHGSEITFATFTPDGTRVATTGYDGLAVIWDTRTGAKLRTITATTGLLRQLYGRLSPNGKHLLTTTIRGDSAAWDIDTGERVGGYNHGDMVLGGEPSADGKLAATCGMDRLAKVWDAVAEHPAPLRVFAGHTDALWKCVFSPDTRYLLTTSQDGHAMVWAVATGGLVARAYHGAPMLFCHFSPDGHRFVTIGVDGIAKVWDSNTGGRLASHDIAGGKDAQFTPDGKSLVTARGDGRLRRYTLAAGPLAHSLTPPAHAAVRGVSDDGARAVLEADDGWVTLWDVVAGAPLRHDPIHAPIALAGGLLAAASGERTLVLDLKTGATLRAIVPPQRYALLRAPPKVGLAIAAVANERPASIAVSDGAAPRIAIGQAGAVHVFALDGRSIATLDGATQATLSDDGRLAATWRTGALPRVWDLDHPELPPVAILTTGLRYQPIGFGLDGTRLVLLVEAPRGTREVTIWDTRSGLEIGPAKRRLDISLGPSLDHRRRYVTTIGSDHVVTVWDLADGSAHRSFIGEGLIQAQLHPEGELLAGIDAQGTAALMMNANDGRVLARWLIEHDPPMITETSVRPAAATATWSRDGATVITRAATVAVWNAFTSWDRANLARLEEIVREHVPWRLIDGRLELVAAEIEGVVTWDGQPVRGAKVVAEIHKTPDMGAAPISWDATTPRVQQTEATTGEHGEFTISNLFPGQYTVKVSRADAPTKTITVNVGVDSERVAIELP